MREVRNNQRAPRLTAFCACPDRHEPKMVCGYPMPCPHHTPECARKIKVLAVLDRRAATKRRVRKAKRG